MNKIVPFSENAVCVKIANELWVFAQLQTKNCGFLVTILAYLNRIIGTRRAENVLRIKQIEHMVQNNGSRCEAVATKFYEWAVMRKERPECRTDEWKSMQIDVENYVKERRETVHQTSSWRPSCTACTTGEKELRNLHLVVCLLW